MPRGYAYVEISALATLPFAFHTKDNTFHRFPYDVVSCGTPSPDIDVVDGYTITMQAEKPISTPQPKQVRIDELAVYVVNVVIEKLTAVLEI